jgi:hypothetical protein
MSSLREMSDEDYFKMMDERREEFWKKGHNFKPVVGCGECEPIMEDNNYICIYHELDQLQKAGC